MNILEISTPSQIEQLIESGIISSLYYAADVYYVRGRADISPGADGFLELAANLLDHITIFIPHLCVLRAVIRDIHGFCSTALDNFSPGIKQSKALGIVWRRLFDKSDAFYLIRCNFKQMGLCEYDKCPTSLERPTPLAPQSQKNLGTRYLRCMGCSTMLYCSHACRKADWQVRHKKECPQRSQELRSRPFKFDYNDRRLVSVLLSIYVRTQAQSLAAMIEAYNRSNPPSRRNHTRKPLVWLDFQRPGNPPQKMRNSATESHKK
ncbi:hypothetical protein PM082_024116 [Marasmius tenuissimus]|nr:hypothetical protein PM082_024116 [Marasmius tenuissimus]